MLAGSVVLDTPKQIRLFRLVVQRSALKLEMLGMKHSSGRSAYAAIKREFGFRGNKERVYTQFCEYIEKEKGNG